ncbi:MAG: outer membrane protein assembly factor BamA [Acidobacteria bacterium]|nr:outer membrane protein assembly factor BamA [Acidobacteriota bacterium]
MAVLLTALAASAQAPVIEDVRWEGLRRIPRDTMNARILSKRGDPYDPHILQRDFQAVWNTNFFEDVRLEVEDGESGKIVYFIVVERPLVRRITYVGIKSVTQSEILERFRERRVGLSVEMQYDPTRVRQAEVALRELLAERGRHFANVWHETRRIPPNAVTLTFVVEEGAKVKVGEVVFEGNRHFSDRRLLRAMKGSRPYGIPYVLPLFAKTYNANKVQEDLERVRELYQEFGYFRAVVHSPETRIHDTDPMLPMRLIPWWFKPGKAVDMRVSVEEGGRYRMGKLTVRSATGKDDELFFKAEFLKQAFPLIEGDIFNVTKIRKALQDYTKLYSEFGFINMTPLPETEIDDLARVIDFTLDIEPGKQFFVHRIEFLGNTTTRDKVIRRELLLDEGSVFNSRLWETSILRLNQLGYFEELKPENADVQQNAEQGTVDLTLKVRERGKNSIGLSGGASGVLGSFIGLNYSTNNFLGLGENLDFNTEWGDRQRSFLFGFTEPYLFDRPIQSGFTVFVRRFEFNQVRETAAITGTQVDVDPLTEQRLLNYIQNSAGFSVFASYPMRRWRFARVGLSYGYDVSDISCLTEGCSSLFEGLQFRTVAGPNALEGIRSSRLTPTFLYNSVNHPLFPTGGTSFFVGGTIEGGPLGGNQKTIRPTFEFKHFHPINRRRNTLAFRLLGAFVTGYGGRVASPFNRFYIGGEDTVRGFDIRGVSPLAFVPTRSFSSVFFLDPTRLDPLGNPALRAATVEVLSQRVSVPGGDTQLVGNFEYRIPLVGPVSIVPFFDVGLNTILRRSQLRLTQENLDSLRTDFPGASVPDNLELVPGTNSRIRTSAGIEWVVNLPIVNAPFRIYWAYNLNRLTQDITSPPAAFRLAPGSRVPPGVFEEQIVPQLERSFAPRTFRLAEPVKTVRFTISRTF